LNEQEKLAGQEGQTTISQPDVCPVCGGSGYEDKIDILAAKRTHRKCLRCGGSGKRNPDGVRFRRISGFPAVVERMKDGKAVSTVQLTCWPAVLNSPLIICDIVRMATRPKHRRKGYATQIIVQLQLMRHVLGIRTSWDDSDEAGKALLMKQGFTRKGNLLLWENQYAYGLLGKGLKERGKLEGIIASGRPHDPRDGSVSVQQPDNAEAEPEAHDAAAGRDTEDSPPRITGTGR